MTKPNAKHLALGVFVGKWITQGTIRATEGAATSEIRAIDQYELPEMLGRPATPMADVIARHVDAWCA